MKITEYAALGLVAFALASATVLPRLEGRFFPVMGPMTISDPQSAPPPAFRLQWTATAEKLRACSFVRLEWYLGQRGGARISIKAEFEDPPRIRHVGQQVWTTLLISLDQENTLGNSHADIVHQCPWRNWETISPLYN